MQGQAEVATFGHIGMDPATAPMLRDMLGPGGPPLVCPDVWIASLGSAPAERTGRLARQHGWNRNEEQSALAQARQNELTTRERKILDAGASNLEFHDLGSAKIIGRIGRGFAETMARLKHPTRMARESAPSPGNESVANSIADPWDKTLFRSADFLRAFV